VLTKTCARRAGDCKKECGEKILKGKSRTTGGQGARRERRRVLMLTVACGARHRGSRRFSCLGPEIAPLTLLFNDRLGHGIKNRWAVLIGEVSATGTRV